MIKMTKELQRQIHKEIKDALSKGWRVFARFSNTAGFWEVNKEYWKASERSYMLDCSRVDEEEFDRSFKYGELKICYVLNPITGWRGIIFKDPLNRVPEIDAKKAGEIRRKISIAIMEGNKVFARFLIPRENNSVYTAWRVVDVTENYLKCKKPGNTDSGTFNFDYDSLLYCYTIREKRVPIYKMDEVKNEDESEDECEDIPF